MQQEVTASFSGEGTGTGKIFVSTGSAAYNIAGQFDRARRFFTFAIAEIGLAVGIIVFASIGSVVQGLTSSIRTLLLYVLPLCILALLAGFAVGYLVFAPLKLAPNFVFDIVSYGLIILCLIIGLPMWSSIISEFTEI